jgi:hypothetical protein
MGASIFFTATVIRAFRSARSRGNGGTYTVHSRSLGFLVINVCNHAEHYEMPFIIHNSNLLLYHSKFLNCSLCIHKQDRQCTYNVTLRRGPANTVAVEKQ